MSDNKGVLTRSFENFTSFFSSNSKEKKDIIKKMDQSISEKGRIFIDNLEKTHKSWLLLINEYDEFSECIKMHSSSQPEITTTTPPETVTPSDTEKPLSLGEESEQNVKPQENEKPFSLFNIGEEVKPQENEKPLSLGEESKQNAEKPFSLFNIGEEVKPPETEKPLSLGEESEQNTEKPLSLGEESKQNAENPFSLGEESEQNVEKPFSLGEEESEQNVKPPETPTNVKPSETDNPLSLGEEPKKPSEEEKLNEPTSVEPIPTEEETKSKNPVALPFGLGSNLIKNVDLETHEIENTINENTSIKKDETGRGGKNKTKRFFRRSRRKKNKKRTQRN